MKRRRAGWWLLAALVLFAAASWLMARGDEPEPIRAKAEDVRMPRRMQGGEKKRLEDRRVELPVSSPLPNAPRTTYRDPVMAVLPSKVEHVAMVVEANAIRNSPVGQLLVDCLMSRDDGARVESFKQELGFDPFKDLDRVALTDEGVVLSGQFKDARFDRFSSRPAKDFGPNARIYEPTHADGGVARERVGVWKDQMMLVGRDEESLKRMLERLDGKSDGPSALRDEQSYGEIYGVISGNTLAELFEDEQPQLAERMKSALGQVELHVDTMHDVGVVADSHALNGADGVDLGKSLGAALAVVRVKAQADGQKDLAQFLERAKVHPSNEGFQLELALPLEVLETRLKKCVEDNRARVRDGG